MDVTLIAAPNFFKYASVLATGASLFDDDDQRCEDADELTEFAGRACYQSWNKPNPATATNRGYLANIIAQEHFSVMEHATFVFYVQGVSRALTHELARHRHLSLSQLSQRFVAEDARLTKPVVPPAMRGDETMEYHLQAAHDFAMDTYITMVNYLTDKGLPRKKAREAARAVLPNAQETKLVVSGNLRAWREFIAKRSDPSADAEMQEFADIIRHTLKNEAPNSMQDL